MYRVIPVIELEMEKKIEPGLVEKPIGFVS